MTKNTIRNLIQAYKRVKEEGIDVGFLTPVLNVNNVSYIAFLKTLNLIDEYTHLFEKPIFARNWHKQKIWYDPVVAKWIWKNPYLSITSHKYLPKKMLDFMSIYQ